MSTIEQRSRWTESRRLLRDGRVALAAGNLREAMHLFTRAHDFGDDHAKCHGQAHLGRARVEIRQGKLRGAAFDVILSLLSIVVSPLRSLRGARGHGFATEKPP